MAKTEEKKHRYGLIGKHISYSFSKGYFADKFKTMGLDDHSYVNFDLDDISQFEELVAKTRLKGLNVTIPYKETILSYLDKLDSEAKKIGAVNTIKFHNSKLIGHNTDVYGFQKSIEPLLREHHRQALILGTGGASKAVAYVLEKLGIHYSFVSRTQNSKTLTYTELDSEMISDNLVIVNCTPLGTHPNIQEKPDLPYLHLTEKHLLYDLIYNPKKTAFLSEGEKKGCTIKNGLEMLQLQAEKAWKIWNS